MSLLPVSLISDKDYPVYMLWAIESAHAGIFGNKSQFFQKDRSIFSVNELFKKLEEINGKLGAPYGDGYETPPHPLYYRTPIWQVVDEVLKEEAEKSEQFWLFKNPGHRAEWFQGILKLCVRYEQVQLKTNEYINSLKQIGLGVDIGGSSQPITIIFNDDQVGKNAHPVAERVVQKLLDAVTVHVEEFLKKGSVYPKNPTE